jgi:MarR family transcriptional regulator, organic hydroperoxide resistance regulator
MVMTSRDASGESSPDDAAELAKSIHDIILSVLRQIQPTVEAEQISKGQFLAMHVLSSMNAASVSDVARHLAIKAPTVCVTVDQLEEAGLVTRQRSARDHRTVEVSLTPKGRRVEARVWTRIGRRIAEAAGDLPPDDLAAAIRVFRELNRRLNTTPHVPGVEA